MAAALGRYPALAWRYLAQYLKTVLEYRGSVAVEMFSYILWIVTDAALIWFVLLPAGHLGGWSLPQVLLIFGIHMAALGLFFTIGVNLFYLPGSYILEGQLDRLLLRPLNPYFQLLMERMSFEDTITVVTGTLVSLWALQQLGMPLHAGSVALLFLAIWSGSLVYLGMLTGTAALSFWLKDRTGLMQIMLMVGDQLATYPLSIYPSALRLAFTFGIPLGFVAFYPAHLFFGGSEVAGSAVWIGWVSPLVGACCAGLGYGLWCIGLRSYESAGS